MEYTGLCECMYAFVCVLGVGWGGVHARVFQQNDIT